MKKTHQLKTWPEYFEAVDSGEKTFEIRKADRDFEVGDILELQEWQPKGYSSVSPNELEGEYTGRKCLVEVGYIYIPKGNEMTFGVDYEYCVMSIKKI